MKKEDIIKQGVHNSFCKVDKKCNCKIDVVPVSVLREVLEKRLEILNNHIEYHSSRENEDFDIVVHHTARIVYEKIKCWYEEDFHPVLEDSD